MCGRYSETKPAPAAAAALWTDYRLGTHFYISLPWFSFQDAETAINAMNGQWLGGRVIRTNWATRRPASNANNQQEGSQGNSTPKYTPLTFDEVYNQASPTHCTVYC